MYLVVSSDDQARLVLSTELWNHSTRLSLLSNLDLRVMGKWRCHKKLQNTLSCQLQLKALSNLRISILISATIRHCATLLALRSGGKDIAITMGLKSALAWGRAGEVLFYFGHFCYLK